MPRRSSIRLYSQRTTVTRNQVYTRGRTIHLPPDSIRITILVLRFNLYHDYWLYCDLRFNITIIAMFHFKTVLTTWTPTFVLCERLLQKIAARQAYNASHLIRSFLLFESHFFAPYHWLVVLLALPVDQNSPSLCCFYNRCGNALSTEWKWK